MMKPRRQKFFGFTLIETLIVVFIFVILMILITGIYLSNNRFYENQTGKIAGSNAMREAADRLNEYARLAVGIENSYVYNMITYTTSSSTAVFKLPSVDSNSDIITGVYDYVVFSKDISDASRLRLIVEPADLSARPARELLLSDHLTYMNLVYDDADITQAKSVAYEIRVTEGGRHPATEEIFGTATLRN